MLTHLADCNEEVAFLGSGRQSFYSVTLLTRTPILEWFDDVDIQEMVRTSWFGPETISGLEFVQYFQRWSEWSFLEEMMRILCKWSFVIL